MLFRFAVLSSLLWTSSALASFTSIAYSPETGRYGFAASAPSPGWAEEHALEACGDYGCEIAITVENGFAALSINRRGSVFVGAAAGSKERSWDSAIDLCEQETRRGRCRILVWAGASSSSSGYVQPSPPPQPHYPQEQGPRVLPAKPTPSHGSPNSGPSYPAPVWR